MQEAVHIDGQCGDRTFLDSDLKVICPRQRAFSQKDESGQRTPEENFKAFLHIRLPHDIIPRLYENGAAEYRGSGEILAWFEKNRVII